MAKILVIGAGGVGGSMASIAETRSFFDSFIFADINSGRGDEIIAKLEDPGRFSSAKVDARSKTDIVALAQRVKADVIVNACDPRLNEPIFEAAFGAGCTYLDMAMNLSKPHATNPYEEVG